MDVIWFYLLACVPVFAGAGLWLRSRRVVWGEWLASSAAAFAMAGMFHALASWGQTADVEIWSGQLMQGRHNAAWLEYYEYAVYRTEYYTETVYYTDSKGRSQSRQVQRSREVFDHWEPTKRWHHDSYRVVSNINTSYDIDAAFFERVAASWGGVTATPGRRRTGEHASRMIGGDPNDYVTQCAGYVWPVTKLVSFENRIKATPTTFAFPKVPATEKVFPYPGNKDPFRSDRLLGTADVINTLVFDQLNARLGPAKRVNVILIGFGNRDAMAALWQEAAWVGGKTNDVVICWGGLNSKPTWVRAFGWTDSKTCLRALESIVLDRGMSETTLPFIEQEIRDRYQLKDWKQFDYIRVPAPVWALWTYLLTMVLAQGGYWWWAVRNDYNKNGDVIRSRMRRLSYGFR